MAGAQAQITTKKMKIKDFTDKVTKVVLTGNDFYDSMLKDEVRTHWRVSPYEFCTHEEFVADSNSSEYYFLVTTSGKFKKESEPGLDILTLLKGGSGANINSMLEVVYLPFASAEDPSGRESIFFPALLNIIQNHALKAIETDIAGYLGLSKGVSDLSELEDVQFVFSIDDLSTEITPELHELHFTSDMTVTDEDSTDDHMMNHTPNTLVSYVVAPSDLRNGAFCYKMLINSETHELYYFRRHRLSSSRKAGFLLSDIKRINNIRKR